MILTNALKNLVIDVEDEKNEIPYPGVFTVKDGLNPPLVKNLKYLTFYCEWNQSPKLNISLQEQVDKVPVLTGQHFGIQFDAKTFQDTFVDNLEYSIMMQDKNTHVPKWLDLRGLILSGTPPEQLTGLTLNLVFVAKNEFKSTSVPFTLEVKISMLYGIKLIFMAFGYLVTAIGFLLRKKFTMF